MSLLAALEYAADALGKPGRAARGVLAGRPDEGFAALPFSDSLGITDPARQASGADLTGGATTGLLAELLLDPLNLVAGAGLARRAAPAAAAAGREARLLGSAASDAIAAYRGHGGSVAGMLPLRRDFTVAKDLRATVGEPLELVPHYVVGPGGREYPLLAGGRVQTGFLPGTSPHGTAFSARPVGGVPGGLTEAADRYRDVREAMSSVGTRMGLSEGVAGAYSPAHRTAVIRGADFPGRLTASPTRPRRFGTRRPTE
jgi:hypothetical protein